MADISQIKLPNGDTYNLVDETSGYISQFVITFTEVYDSTVDDYVWTMDKTITEIDTAYDAGKELVCNIEGYEYIPLKSASRGTYNSDYYFERVTFPYSDSIGVLQAIILYDSFSEKLNIGVSLDGDTAIILATPNSFFVVPAGGTTGQVLMKTSDYNYDFAWTNLPIYDGTVV